MFFVLELEMKSYFFIFSAFFYSIRYMIGNYGVVLLIDDERHMRESLK
jgi:hypothetical protein